MLMVNYSPVTQFFDRYFLARIAGCCVGQVMNFGLYRPYPDKVDHISSVAFLYDYIRTSEKNRVESVGNGFQGTKWSGKWWSISVSSLRGGSKAPDILNCPTSKDVESSGPPSDTIFVTGKHLKSTQCHRCRVSLQLPGLPKYANEDWVAMLFGLSNVQAL